MSLPHLPWTSPAAGTDAPCIADAERILSYRAVERRAAAFAEQLLELGVGAGDVVAIMLPNSVELLIGMLGAWRIGAAVTPVNPTFTVRELEYQVADSRARILLAPPTAPAVDVPVIVPEHMRALPEEPIEDPRILGADLALLVYTSGSTGQPKGVMLDHDNLAAMAGSLVTHLDLSSSDHALLVLPLFHVNSICISFLAPMAAGARVTILERFSPEPFLDALDRFRPSYFSAVPAIFARLAELPAERTAQVRSLRFAICGAAPVSKQLLRRCEERFGFAILEGYGLTESTCASACNPLWGIRKPGTVGRALPGQQIAIVDEDGRLVPTGRRGEIIISGPTVMRGYLGRPDATSATVHGGWLHTGDVGILDREGYLTIVDRIKDMIIRGGENLYPKEIEAFLATHPEVLESAVVGAPHDVLGEVPVAYVVLLPGGSATADDLLAHCRTGLTKIKIPARLEIVEALPRNPVGKIDKPALRRLEPAVL
ncbi:class I adenylate-forming enzyme family protein [uncultured Microbacterium sp.]|uniref:class I adenylate-forming enzyme family protein n=1 Tax=uncultured Microbacterium sp. TaxID=191216 RepID=UPI0025F29217|nr:AMP-binding protein [uncultured Microbacterium sp.]